MLCKEIFVFLSRIYISQLKCENKIENSPDEFFCFANKILENAKMQHIAVNKRNKNRLKRISVSFLLKINT